MKVVFFIIVLISMFVLTSCKENEVSKHPLVGDWDIISIQALGYYVDEIIDDSTIYYNAGESVFEFDDNNKLYWRIDGVKLSYYWIWTFEENEVNCTDNNKFHDLEGTIEMDTLKLVGIDQSQIGSNFTVHSIYSAIKRD